MIRQRISPKWPVQVSRRFPALLAAVVASSAGTLAGALAAPSIVQAGFDEIEQGYQFLYLATPIDLEGRIVDEDGYPLVGAQLRLIGWGEGDANDGEATSSWFGGTFTLAGLARRNALLEVSLEGYYTEVIPVELQRGLDEDALAIPDIELVAREFGRARLTFTGDTMFDRRMFTDGVLAKSTLTADSKRLFRFVEPVLEADDHTAINLETPVTDHLWTPHPTKSYVFNAFPKSAAVLPGVGVESVSLGNNHMYDYLALGVIDTLANLDAIGLDYYGAGLDPNHAAATKLRKTIHGVDLSLQGFSEMVGYTYGGNANKIIALANPSKPGALHCSGAQLDAFVDGEVASGRLAIPVIHGGAEYACAMTDGMRDTAARAIDHGAGLVIAHHPHVVHGVHVYDGGEGPRYVFGSLGNFVFDQRTFETLRSYAAVVDVVDGTGGPQVERVRLIPMRLDDYAPRLLVGEALAQMGRYVAHLSTAGAGGGFAGAVVFAEGGRLVVMPSEDADGLEVTDLLDVRQLELDADGGTGVIALDPYTETDALAGLTSNKPADCELGRDLLGIGNFEDPDVDDAYLEGDLWMQSKYRYVQGVDVHRGVGAAVLLRRSSSKVRTSLWMGNRVRVTPGRRMSIHGWHKGVNAGLVTYTVAWIGAGGGTISNTIKYVKPGGDWEWSPFTVDLTVPGNARGVKVYVHHYPPGLGSGSEGRLVVDDVAFVEWGVEVEVGGGEGGEGEGVGVETPNGWDFVRCEAGGVGVELGLIHRVYALQ